MRGTAYRRHSAQRPRGMSDSRTSLRSRVGGAAPPRLFVAWVRARGRWAHAPAAHGMWAGATRAAAASAPSVGLEQHEPLQPGEDERSAGQKPHEPRAVFAAIAISSEALSADSGITDALLRTSETRQASTTDTIEPGEANLPLANWMNPIQAVCCANLCVEVGILSVGGGTGGLSAAFSRAQALLGVFLGPIRYMNQRRRLLD